MIHAARVMRYQVEVLRELVGARLVMLSKLPPATFVRNLVVDGFVCRLVEHDGERLYARITRV